MFANPLTPNIPDYLAFIYGIGVPTANFPSTTGVATGGDLNSLTDSAATWTVNQWQGYVVFDSSQGISVSIASNTGQTLTFATPLSTPIRVADKYLIASQWLFTTYAVALDTVNDLLCIGSSQLYVLGVYNLGADRLINYAQDVPDQTYFFDQRKDYAIFRPSAGLPSSANDGGTAVGILNPEWMKTMTLQDLQTMKTPFGRRYMEIAQNFGVIWGMS